MASLVFFGSFQSFSTLTLQGLLQSGLTITAVVTTPPRPGDRGTITKTHTHIFCENNHLPVFALETLVDIPPTITRPDFIFVSGYGKLIPDNWLKFPKFMAVNAHQSLLPDYAGRFPAEWAILNGATVTGVTLIKMTSSFDRGDILAQQQIPILPADTRESLYQKLYKLSSELFVNTFPKIISGQIKPLPQTGTGFYARQITKTDGYFAPELLADKNNFAKLNRMIRALAPWPGVWTFVTDKNNQKLKMKIFSFNTKPVVVQIEGKKPALWSEIAKYYSIVSLS